MCSGSPERRVGRTRAGAAALALAVAGAALAVSCEREVRELRAAPFTALTIGGVRDSTAHAGPGGMTTPRGGAAFPASPLEIHDEKNAYALSQGQRLYEAFNCVGCHAHGGGSIGPALMDLKAQASLHAQPREIFDTIMRGRPNGMPSFAGRISEAQAWLIVAYVRSMNGLSTTDAAPGREDHMTGPKPENSRTPPRRRPFTPTRGAREP